MAGFLEGAFVREKVQLAYRRSCVVGVPATFVSFRSLILVGTMFLVCTSRLGCALAVAIVGGLSHLE